jgi:hypothetical protein
LFLYRQVGSRGCEIVNGDGEVIAWTVDDYWAATICRLLNDEHRDLIVWDHGVANRRRGS